jgi:hypothetical protein
VRISDDLLEEDSISVHIPVSIVLSVMTCSRKTRGNSISSQSVTAITCPGWKGRCK